MGRARWSGVVATVVCSGGLLLAPAALAADRYAEPDGDGPPGSCLLPDPCDIQDAVEDPSVTDGDVVHVLPGDHVYSTFPDPTGANTVVVDDGITVRGEPGQPRPRIIITGNGLRVFDPDAVIRRLHIEANSGTHALGASVPATLEQLVLVATGNADHAAVLEDGALLRDSVAWSDLAQAVVTRGTGATLTNVTAIGTDFADGVLVDSDFGGTQTVTDGTLTVIFNSLGLFTITA